MEEPVPKLPPELLEKVVAAGRKLIDRKLAAKYSWAMRVENHPEDWEVLQRPEWGEGPWLEEPDLVEWRMTDCSYPLIIRRGGTGALCGYVGVPPEHPFYRRSAGLPGVNFAGESDERRSPTGEPPTFWFFGFDCGRGYMPYHEGFFRLFRGEGTRASKDEFHEPGSYVTLEQCRARVEALAQNLKYWEESLLGKTTRDNGDGTVTILDADGKTTLQIPADSWEGFTKLGR